VKAFGSDPLLAARVKAGPGVRVPGCWNGFELATRAILGQQITVRGATALAGRMVNQFGKRVSGPGGLTHIFPTPDVLAGAKLTSIGLTGARAETIRALAQAVVKGKIAFEGVLDSEAFLRSLMEIPGIGKWTAQYIAMRALGEPDAFPSSDLHLLRAAGLGSDRELEQRAEAWRPWRAYAAMYMWRVCESAALETDRLPQGLKRQPLRRSISTLPTILLRSADGTVTPLNLKQQPD
jgi:AraC family transcriptional regulator of adaptative response / DNA-3-methyladenine glycosylase II